jgi:hypothetical protein
LEVKKMLKNRLCSCYKELIKKTRYRHCPVSLPFALFFLFLVVKIIPIPPCIY